MKIVNRYFIDDILSPIVGLADSESDLHLFGEIDTSSELELKKFFRDIIKPTFDFKKEKVKYISKNSLSYYLKTNKINFESLFYSCLLPLEPPKDFKLFFIFLWEVLFPNQSFDDISIEDFHENFDINLPWQIELH